MTHTMTGPTQTGDTVAIGCTCGNWHRLWHHKMAPGLQEMESDHEAHMHRAGAEDLRAGITKVTPPAPTTLDGLTQIARALADAAAAGVKAMESMTEFVEAHKEATDRGIGVTVVRQPDGSITTTPNLFVAPGTAIFMDAPGPMAPPKLNLVPDAPRPEYLPRYTIAHGTVTINGAPITTHVA